MTRRTPNHSSRSPGRRAAVLAAALLTMTMTGCTMCPDPLDYSGSVPNGSAPQNDFWARSNGILPLHASPKPWPAIVKRDQQPTPAEPLDPEAPQVADVPRSVLAPQAAEVESAVVAETPAAGPDVNVLR